MGPGGSRVAKIHLAARNVAVTICVLLHILLRTRKEKHDMTGWTSGQLGCQSVVMFLCRQGSAAGCACCTTVKT